MTISVIIFCKKWFKNNNSLCLIGNTAFNLNTKNEIFLSIDGICDRSDFFSTFDNYGNLSLCQDNDFSDYANKGMKE